MIGSWLPLAVIETYGGRMAFIAFQVSAQPLNIVHVRNCNGRETNGTGG